MITLTCSKCAKNLKVKDELAGKKIRCPQCKQVLEVAAPVSEDATVPPRAQHQEEEATRGPSWSPPADAEPVRQSAETMIHDRDEETEKDLAAATNYKVAGEIARGGMGAIKRAVDQDICREVAVKFLLNNVDDRQKARFVEEAQITGQLEHPNIVPIHQLGIDGDGCAFFSMKMVKGRSLADILKGEPSRVSGRSPGEYTLGRLLNIMISICNALSYAHSRQVIHRDLKPANIMVGDFGEVYVMDWGLAKVLGKEEMPPTAASTQIKSQRAPRVSAGSDAAKPDSKSLDKVTTHGRGAGELTQAGAVMGTPAYMPPEQAQGNLDDVDERSDIYSLGAILYEMMTLTPPVGRGGDMLAILMRVVEGQIDPPAERAPERARAGWIPPELSAIALKALAKKRKHRYQTVAEFKRDIELFLEGRSVSAKQDSFREMLWKLVKRNKGASVATGVGMLLLLAVVGVSFQFINAARLRAEDERKNTKAAYQAYQDQVKDSVPAFLRAAKAALKERQFDDALTQASMAAKSAPDNAEARLLKGQLLVTRKRFAEAIPELEEYLKLAPENANAPKLANLCRKAQTETAGSAEETASLLAIAEFFTQLRDYHLTDGVLSSLGKDALEARQRALEFYRKRIEAAWPGKGSFLTMSQEGRFDVRGDFGGIADLTAFRGIPLRSLLLASYSNQFSDLEPLRGMPLTALDLFGSAKLRDLTPLKGMRLTYLRLDLCGEIQDLAPLKGMPLTSLGLHNCVQIRDLEPLKDMPLTWLDLSYGPQVQDLAPLKGMPLTFLQLPLGNGVRNLEVIKGMKLTHLSALGYQMEDLELLKGMPLTWLALVGCTKLRDLEPLRGMKLTTLNLHDCTQIRDLDPLKGMLLTSSLDLGGCGQLRDLEPLKGMPLTELIAWGTQIKDLKPLKGMRLTLLNIGGCKEIRDLEPLKGMPLTALQLGGCKEIQDLSPIKGMPLKKLHIHFTRVTELQFLQDMQLEEILLTPKNITQGLDILRNMKSLKTIGVNYLENTFWPAAEFWDRYEKGEFKK